MTAITTIKEMPTQELKSLTLNIKDLSPFGQFVLNGATTAVLKRDSHDGQFIDLYLNGRRYYKFGFTHWKDEGYYGENGLAYVKEGYELVG